MSHSDLLPRISSLPRIPRPARRARLRRGGVLVGLLGLLAPLAATTLAAPARAASTDPAPACTDVVLYGIRGSGQTVGSSAPAGFGPQAAAHALLAATALRSGAQGPARTVSFQYDDYPALPIAPPLLGSFAIDLLVSSAQNGAQRAVADLAGIVAACPSTKIVVIGYSQGGMVADYLVRLLGPAAATPTARAVVGVVTLASLTRHANDPAVVDAVFRGQAPWDGWLAPRLPSLAPAAAAGRVLSVCNALDKACDQQPGTPMALTTEHSDAYYDPAVLAGTAAWIGRQVARAG